MTRRSAIGDRQGPVSWPLIEGAVAGIAAWVVGYTLTYLLIAADIRDSSMHRFIEAFEGEPATYEQVAWVFYNAHLVDTAFSDIPIIGTTSTSFIGGDGGFSALLYLVPVATLVLAGLLLTWYDGAENPTAGALAGITIVPGYLVVSIAGVFLAEVTIGGARGSPDLLSAIFLAGIVFPVVFGVVGGLVGATIRTRS